MIDSWFNRRHGWQIIRDFRFMRIEYNEMIEEYLALGPFSLLPFSCDILYIFSLRVRVLTYPRLPYVPRSNESANANATLALLLAVF